jgi:acetyl-CoA synthetase
MLYKRFIDEKYSDTGELLKIDFNLPNNFNFAYDVVDEIAMQKPNNIAMIWCNDQGEEHIFTFKDIKEKSDKAAAYFSSLGIKKGDFVMLILKRHYQFWFAIMGLCKIGAVVIPATNQLMVKDLVYRLNSADVCAVVCTADGEISDNVDLAQAECPTLKHKIITRGHKFGWANFDDEIEKFDGFERPSGELQNKVTDMMLLYFTSGTTGLPKMVVHNFGYAMAHYTTARHWHNVRYQKPHLTVSETGWGKSVWGKLYGQWLMECIVFVYDFDKFNANELLKQVEKQNSYVLCAADDL